MTAPPDDDGRALHELVLKAPQPLVEPVSDALMLELQALSVSVEDSDADSAHEQALFGEPGLPAPAAGWQRSTLRALFASEADATEAATLLLAQDWSAGLETETLRAVPPQDWVRLTQSQFAPVEITPDFFIVPTWHAAPAAARQVIHLDPGRAFGTGTHPTTRMCLRWIATHAQAWPRVLDYGCGSGVLAMACARFGARAVDAVDIDPVAVEVTRANAHANDVTLHAGTTEHARGAYALVLANILAAPLKLLAPLLSTHVDHGGTLVLAGILERQADELRAAYAPWCALGVSDREDGWVLMTARRP